MAKKIRFPLKLAEGKEARALDELREYFDLEAVVEYYKNGKLLTWLEDRYLEGEADAVRTLDEAKPSFRRQLCAVFQVEYTGGDEDLEDIERRQERIKRLHAITDNPEFIQNIDKVAFNQEELADLLDEGETKIYLCGEKFTVPASCRGITYIGIMNPTVHISGNMPEKLWELGIEFVGVDCDNLPEAPATELGVTPSISDSLDRKLVMLFKETSTCYCMAITKNYVIFEKKAAFNCFNDFRAPFLKDKNREDREEILANGKYCLNLHTLEIKNIPENLYIPTWPVISGDRLIYHLGGQNQVKYFDVLAMENGDVFDFKSSQYLDASSDYILAGSGWSEAKLLNLKTGKIQQLNDAYGKILDGEIYTLKLNENKVYNPEKGTTRLAKEVTWDFIPEKVCGNKMYGTVDRSTFEQDVRVVDRTTGSKRSLFKYYNYNCRSQISVSDGYWVLADQKDSYKDPVVIRAIDLETSEVRKIASISPANRMGIIGVINNWFYYRTQEEVRKSDGENKTIWHIYKVNLANPEQNEEIN